MENNQITGTIPSWKNLTSLKVVWVPIGHETGHCWMCEQESPAESYRRGTTWLVVSRECHWCVREAPRWYLSSFLMVAGTLATTRSLEPWRIGLTLRNWSTCEFYPFLVSLLMSSQDAETKQYLWEPPTMASTLHAFVSVRLWNQIVLR